MTGNWENLIIKTFSCDAALLEKCLPRDIELDLYQNKALFSMVAFTFSKVKFFGFKIPLHQSFGEINFRCYVKSKIDGTKGVVFIKELAPKPLMALIANGIYNEPFYYKKITKKIISSAIYKDICYSFKSQKKWYAINTTILNEKIKLKTNSLQEFIVDRYIAFVKGRRNTTYEYKINHKPWQLFNIQNVSIPKEVLSLLPTKFHTASEIATYVVDGSAITVEKGILQKQTNLALI